MPTTATVDRRHWEAADWRAHARTIILNGRRLRFLDVGAGPPLLLIHGLGGSWHSWLENLPALAARYRVIAVDLPGFGGSDQIRGASSLPSHARTISELLVLLQIVKVSVLAHSMGGLVAIRLATERPELVRRLVLVNAGGVPISAFRLALIGYGFKAAKSLIGHPLILGQIARSGHLRRAAMWLFLHDASSLSPRMAAEILPRMAAPGLAGAVGAASREVGRVDPSEVRCPVLVVWGANDRLLPLVLAETLVEALPSGELAVIEDAGHCPMIEVPEEFDRVALAFLDRRRLRSVPKS
ncbi:MAG: alpha/beta fold hydrolase [Solirubrobacterales bacterium]|nr:alpha/beta fold hydrolase [Solirubrobacterales bacterium]